MKKLALFFVILIVFTSCEAHIGEQKFYLPWEVLLIFDVVVIATASIIAQIYIVTRFFRCPKCGTVFHPKWYEISSWLHLGSSRFMRCPHCHHRDFCEKIK